ncbi:hypothetical protein [Algoriphagus sp.]|uniref:hypothetical protein n=1 Tax=Algoriphagus sp. TaxID=1872435 RepID=UPI00327E14A1
MKNSAILTTSVILGSLVLASCSTNKLATTDTNDNLYFMASDAKVATEYAVQNNNPEQFQPLSSATETIPQESFSSRNVNPDYIARYQAEEPSSQNDVVYFDEASGEAYNPDIDAYNNFRTSNSGSNSNFNPSLSFNMGMMYGMGGMGMMYGMNPWGMGGFYDPFMGFGPRFSMNIGFGFGYNPFFSPFYYRPSFGMMGFYDPWGPAYGWGYPGFGYYPVYPSNPIYILPGGEYGDRRVVTGPRPTRGSSLAASSRGSNVSNAALQPSTARANARRDVLNNSSSATSRRVVSNSDNSRVSARDFSSSQNDYYNSTSRSGTSRNIGSAAMDRGASTRSAMPSARPNYGTSTNSRSVDAGRGGSVRSTYPSTNSRTTSPSYNRSNVPNRTTSPSYNRGTTNTNTRTVTPTRSIEPSRSSSPTYSSPSRSTGGSTGGATRSTSSTPTRSGRGT